MTAFHKTVLLRAVRFHPHGGYTVREHEKQKVMSF